MEQENNSGNSSGGFYSEKVTLAFGNFLSPFSRLLAKAGISPNTVTITSLILGALTGALFAMDYLLTGFVFGLATGYADLVDGQLAKISGETSRFGAILDSTVDRYIEFFVFAGYAVRYYRHGRTPWIALCAIGFLGSVMISYIKSRAETLGIPCKVGRLQRQDRLTILGLGALFRGYGIDIAITFLAAATQATALQRLIHVYRQDRNQKL